MTTPGKSGSDSGAGDKAIQPHRVGHVNPLGIQASHLLSSPDSTLSGAKAAADNAGRVLEVTPVAPAPTATKQLDSQKAPSELASRGLITDNSKITPSDRLAASPALDKSVPKINVEMQDLDKPPKQQPHFVVKADGRIEMNGDPEKLNSKEIKVQIERAPGQINPTEAQSAAADELVKYLSERIKATNPLAVDGVPLSDQDNIISPELEASQDLKPVKDLKDLTPETKQAIEETNRFKGSNGVDMPMAATERMGSFGTRDVPRQLNETDKEMGVKEAVAGLWKPDRDNAYETVRRHPDGHYRVGRYGFSGNQLSAFLEGLGDPPDPAMIEKLIREGKLPKGFAEKLKNPEFLAKLKGMAQKMKEGGEPTKDEMKELLPKDAQEGVASILMDQMKTKVGDKPGDIAAAMLSGKAPNDVTAADLTSDEGRALSTAGQKLFDIATNRQSTEQQVAGKIPEGEKREKITEALQLAGVPVTDANLSAVNLIVQKESAWNPNAVNNWDSNAAKGTPSKGLMQTIGPTFNSYAIPGHKNILDPVDNMVAGIRYAVDRYGSLQNVPGVKAVARGAAYRGY
jgi:hypothetical protein